MHSIVLYSNLRSLTSMNERPIIYAFERQYVFFKIKIITMDNNAL